MLIGVIRRNEASENSEIRNYESRIGREEEENDLQNRESKLFMNYQENSECYIFGIIDILTPYE